MENSEHLSPPQEPPLPTVQTRKQLSLKALPAHHRRSKYLQNLSTKEPARNRRARKVQARKQFSPKALLRHRRRSKYLQN